MSFQRFKTIFWPVQIILDPYKLYWTRPKTNFHFWILQFDLFPKRFGPIEGQGISARCVVWFANKVYHFVTTDKCTETYFGLNQYVLDLVQNIKFNSEKYFLGCSKIISTRPKYFGHGSNTFWTIEGQGKRSLWLYWIIFHGCSGPKDLLIFGQYYTKTATV